MDNSLKLAGVSVLGAGIGFVIGYKIAEKKMLARFEERLADETNEMREFYQAARKPYATPEEAVTELIATPAEPIDPRQKNTKVQYNKVVPSEQKETEEVPFVKAAAPVVHNVFDESPRIITQDEFMVNEHGHEQATLTYYESSDQLCGERDEPIDNQDLVVGTEYKTNFGKDSSDENVVHIQNRGIAMDFEIVRSFGSYEEEVLGQGDNSVPPHKRHRLEGR